MKIKVNGKSKSKLIDIKCQSCNSELEVEKSDVVKTISDRDGVADIIKCPVCQTEIWIDVSLWRK